MKFEVLKRSNLKRNFIIGIVAIGIISAIVLNFTRAKYRVTESIPLAKGTINYKSYDFKIMAMYQKNGKDEEYIEINEMPKGGYLINEEKSYCTIDNINKDNNAKIYTNYFGEHVISGLKKNSKCYLYFDFSNSLIYTIKGENSQSYTAYDSTSSSNLRYIGSNPNNYIYFNCDDYSNQSNNTCELWRIIGIFDYDTHNKTDELVKIIRNFTIGNYPWDYTDAIGYNNWSTSQLRDMLNNAYYNSLSGKYFDTYNVDFTSTGLKNNETKNMIESITWKIGTINNEETAFECYYAERSGIGVQGNIGLIYPSDFLYSFDNNNLSWMINYVSSMYEHLWTITPGSSNTVSTVTKDGLSQSGPYLDRKVAPSLYLNKDLKVIGGNGSADNPYQISLGI